VLKGGRGTLQEGGPDCDGNEVGSAGFGVARERADGGGVLRRQGLHGWWAEVLVESPAT
jgi:hypothetical protein